MKTHGYTFIELMVVITILGILLFLAAPNLRERIILNKIDQAAGTIASEITKLRSEAVREGVDYVLVFDLDRQCFYNYHTAMNPEKIGERRKNAISFPQGVRCKDIHLPTSGEQIIGEVPILISFRGYVQPVILHLTDGEHYRSLWVQPFLSKVEIREEELFFTDLSVIKGKL